MAQTSVKIYKSMTMHKILMMSNALDFDVEHVHDSDTTFFT